jgi:hypothetical protein
MMTEKKLEDAATEVALAATALFQEEYDGEVDAAKVEVTLRAGDVRMGMGLAVGDVGDAPAVGLVAQLASVGREELKAAVTEWAEALPEGTIEPIIQLVDRLDLMRLTAGNRVVLEA